MKIWRWGPTEFPYSERLQWLTRISTSATGIEDRTRVRVGPRRLVDYQITTLEQQDRRDIERLFFAEGMGPYLVPFWWDVSKLFSFSGNVGGIGTVSFVLPTSEFSTREYTIGGLAVIIAENASYPLTITGFSVSGQNTVIIGTADWTGLPQPTGQFRVYPAAMAKLSPSTSISAITSHYQNFSASFEYLLPSRLSGASLPATYDGLDLLSFAPNRPVNFQKNTTVFSSERLDYDVGTWSTLDEAGAPFITRVHEFLYLEDRPTLFEHRKFFQKMGGREGEFWAPTWIQDLDVSAINEVGGTRYQLVFSHQVDFLDGLSSRENIYLRTRKGNFPGVIQEQSSSTALVIDFETAPVGVTIDDVIQCHWLERVRLAFDEVAISHRTLQQASINVGLTTVK